MLPYDSMEFLRSQSPRQLQGALQAGKDQSRLAGGVATKVKDAGLSALLECRLEPAEQLTGQSFRLFAQ